MPAMHPENALGRLCISTCPVGIIIECRKEGKTSIKNEDFIGINWKVYFMEKINSEREWGVTREPIKLSPIYFILRVSRIHEFRIYAI